MKTGLYFKLAFDGISKNRKLYVPYLITCVLMATVFYIMTFLAKSGMLEDMSGGTSTQMILHLGSLIVGAFAVIFLFYTNSFLIKRRKKEFGLYSVLGMNKKNLGKILFWETGMSWAVSMLCGLGIGIALSKLAEMGFRRLIGEAADYSFSVSAVALRNSLILFAVIFLLILLNALRQVGFASPMELIQSGNSGEKPPKANWITGVLGVLILGTAYYITVSIQQPLSAMLWFFGAVILIIIATYLIFIAGSVLICRILQKNKNYYYKKNHFVSVSSMAYRMKRNGAGLASICILLTMVLVMISSSSCLYIGAEDCLHAQYPREIGAAAYSDGYNKNNVQLAKKMDEEITAVAEEYGAEPQNERTYYEYYISGHLKNSNVKINLNSKSDLSFIKYNELAMARFIALDDYNRMYHKNEKLADGEALVCTVKTDDVSDVLTVGDRKFKVVKRIDERELELDGADEAAVTANIFVIVPDLEKTAKAYTGYWNSDGRPMLSWTWYSQFDTGLDTDGQIALAGHLDKRLEQSIAGTGIFNFYCASHEGQRGDFYGIFGGLFFIGILLSIVFLIACVVIIYYKQISEGYEDRSGFDIMQKVGMTKEDIRKSIDSQMLMVFLLPIGAAIMHLGFIFPVVNKLLMLFALFNVPLFLKTAAVSALICALFYAVVYRITSNTYCRIVSRRG